MSSLGSFQKQHFSNGLKRAEFSSGLLAFFQRAAFASLVCTGVTPIPFEPFRLAAILIRYNVPKYRLAFVARFIHYYFIALIGHLYPIPNRYLIVMAIVLLMISVIGAFLKGRTPPRPFNLTKFF
jgi:membrane protein YqaA with SNARE-associated domain